MSSVGKNLGDLGVAALATYGRHYRAKPVRIRNPGRSATFRQAAIVDELNVKAADIRGCAEHLSLQLAGVVPCRLAAHRRVEREDQPPAPACCSVWPQRPDLIEKTIDFSARRRRWECIGPIARMPSRA
jgi:hypothetical protein